MKGLVQKGRKFAFQAAIPVDVRESFGGKKKYSKTFNTSDVFHAERLAAEAHREFRARVLQLRQAALNGERIDVERKNQLAGYFFAQFYNQHLDEVFFDLRDAISAGITEGQHEQFPLVMGLTDEGVFFDELVQSVETLLYWAEESGFAKNKKAERADATLVGSWEKWAVKAQHTQKTKDQYGTDVRRFANWFEEKYGHCYGARITKRHVNDYVSFLMHRNAAKATINRALSGLRLVYKAGQFSEDNPFSRVSDRMVIEGGKRGTRHFSDEEIVGLFRLDDDPNVSMTIRIAAYSGMRLSEITSLKIKDIERVGTTKVFNLVNAGRRKTMSSYRKVPVHPAIASDLARFIRGRDASDFLIPDEPVDKYGNRSAAISKRIALRIDKITTDPEVRQHALRHTFVTKLAEAGVRKEWRQAAVGHAGQDVHDEYTHANYLSQLLKGIGKIRYKK